MWRRQAMLSIHKSTLSTHWSSNIFSRSLSFDANQSYITSSRLPFNMSPHAIASFTLHAATSTFITATACYSAEHCWNQSKKSRDLWSKDQIMPMRVVYSVFGSTADDGTDWPKIISRVVDGSKPVPGMCLSQLFRAPKCVCGGPS